MFQSLWCVVGLFLAAAGAVHADEGMWTFDDFPAARVERAFGVRLDRDWLDHLQGASVRLTTGCSGSVVSPRGLVLTNHHCVMACAQSLSGPGRDVLTEGFGISAGAPVGSIGLSPISERSCPGMQAEILVGIRDITDPLFAASLGKYGADFVVTREDLITKAERQACHGDAKLRCQVISFFGGGQFKVYIYRKYTDVRLVFAPEYATAFFGGDPDNFNFPRFDLDCAFLRLYDKARPIAARDWLGWTSAPLAAGTPVFVSGSPGATDRSLTTAQLKTLLELVNPRGLEQHERLRAGLISYANQDVEARRMSADRLFDIENGLKILRGRALALNDPAFIKAREADEMALRAKLAADQNLVQQIGDPWADIAAIQAAYRAQFDIWRGLESSAGEGSRLFWYARTLVRAAVERTKPSAARLPEYADSRLALLEKILLDEESAHPSLDRIYLAIWLDETRTRLGPTTTAAAAFVDPDGPASQAARLVDGSSLQNAAYRRTLWRSGLAAIQASKDPLIAYVLRTDPLSRAARLVWEDEVIGPTERAAERIARVRFVVQGVQLYPDATFSPRISFGKVAGWQAAGVTVEPFTTLRGLYGHATGREPFALPRRWLDAKERLDLDTVLNFVTTNDITSGNSGSPVVNIRDEIVGTAFDGNLPSIAGDFVYDPALNRTVVVSTTAITEALTKVYGREDLVRELLHPPS